ncbi:hypothetical protein E8D34_03935 [Nocardioides sp. GY 10113]|uniref:MXAN_6640 family putative metalloprotease n=1 Tax=Nocardioides sp. GY 10113 TaxID=2569761 RepID=UPI0010A92EA3|nr:MXAN_6640 family putative metalloprotease [Nocardioides sp. GY 10113]TIC88818.1 hypothetical protein E8D34_03935 [Nocardioides sp. GY 10113]
MRSRLARVLASLCLTAVVVAPAAAGPLAAPARAASDGARTGASTGATPTAATATEEVDEAGATLGHDREFTLMLRDLFVARRDLGFFARLHADLLLARPTQGNADPDGQGYRRPSTRRCTDVVCVHYVTQGSDAPPSERWARRTLRVVDRVWDLEVDTLGFRAPPTDRRRGGDGRFDVYLADIGSRGLFGYCTPERRVRGEREAASGYCVLDNDFARSQYGTRPMVSLRVTAAHEFFHAIQFGYDFREDPWLLETTASWVEEVFADDANDNRRYLPYGDVRRPHVPLDTYSNTGWAQYGSWPFWEFATARYGANLVRAVWRQADATRGAPGLSSIEALRAVLERRVDGDNGLRTVLTSYALANLDPARAYPEGDQWPAARITKRVLVDRAGEQGTRTLTVDHLAARHLALRPPGGDQRAARRRAQPQRLELTVRAPRRSAVAVTVRRVDGTQRRRVLEGRSAQVVVGFDPGRVTAVVVTAVNASARYRCDRDTLWACGGRPLDEGATFEIGFRALPADG